jgi:hypothetical protein
MYGEICEGTDGGIDGGINEGIGRRTEEVAIPMDNKSKNSGGIPYCRILGSLSSPPKTTGGRPMTRKKHIS